MNQIRQALSIFLRSSRFWSWYVWARSSDGFGPSGTGLQDKIPQNAKLNTRAFKIFFSIPFIYILLISATVGAKISGILETGEDGELIEKSIGVIIPLHLFSMFCIFYCLYFVSKTFKTAELQRKVSFSDFAGEFFLIWFFPIGIWIVQPKINKIAEQPTA